MAVRVSFVEARRSNRLQSFLDGILSALLSRIGVGGNVACDVRVRKEKGAQFKGAGQFSCSILVHGGRRYDGLVVGKGNRISDAVRQALRKFESRLVREHERMVKAQRRRLDITPFFAETAPT